MNTSFKLPSGTVMSIEAVERSLNSRLVVDKTGKFQLSVTRVSPAIFGNERVIEGSKIVNLNCWTEKQKASAIELVNEAIETADADEAGELVQRAMNLRMSTSLLPQSALYNTLEARNAIYGVVTFVEETKDGEPVQDFRINSLENMPVQVASKGAKISFITPSTAKAAPATVGTENTLS